VLRSEVPIVFGKAVLAQAAKAGSLNVMFEETAFDARRGSIAKKKKPASWCGTIGPPIEAEMLLL
jgi:hypothetical protein